MRRFADPKRQALAELSAFYDRVDAAQSSFSCPNRARCCQFATTGREPYLWRLEWLLLEQRVAARGGRFPKVREDGGCRFLDGEGRQCGVYQDRPFGCRTYGCELADNGGRGQRERLRGLNRELGELAQQFDPEDDGPRPISRFFSRAE
ncbi:MAG: YkgJ family cysteine cluster protein [Deltaproteobacteria bacterium]